VSWHCEGVPVVHALAATAGQLPSHLAIGGGPGIAHFLIRLFIWHEIWRLARSLWHIPTFGPWIVVLIGSVLLGLLLWRQQRGPLRLHGRRGRRDSNF
jgi:hypothetical protein